MYTVKQLRVLQKQFSGVENSLQEMRYIANRLVELKSIQDLKAKVATFKFTMRKGFQLKHLYLDLDKEQVCVVGSIIKTLITSLEIRLTTLISSQK